MDPCLYFVPVRRFIHGGGKTRPCVTFWFVSGRLMKSEVLPQSAFDYLKD